MSAQVPRPFKLRFQGTSEDLAGLRWWNAATPVWRSPRPTLQAPLKLPLQFMKVPPDWRYEYDHLHRRGVLIGGGLLLAFFAASSAFRACEDDDEREITLDALELQQKEGWDVGQAATGTQLLFYGRQAVNVDDVTPSPTAAMGLGTALLPQQTLHARLNVHTLFRAVEDPRATSLRTQLVPVHTADMDTVFAQAGAIAALFAAADAPTDLAVVLDLPGPQAVAAATALARRLEPVWLFDNWPHPQGVVRSHEVLGALLYYEPLLRRSADERAALERPAPPLFVLDANRLAPYKDDANQFDNRYVARLPSAATLREAGYRRLLYVRPRAADLQELDDLNDDFVAYREAQLEVRAVALDDFRRPTEASPTTARATSVHYHYGGSPMYHGSFWHSYSWSTRPTPRTFTRVPSVSRGTDYQPTPRATLFSSRAFGGTSGVGKQRPSGFGRVSVRQDSGGRVTGISSGRSGSFGRSRSSFFG